MRNLDAEQLRSECYRRHGYDQSILPVPIEEFLHDEDYCIIKTDSPVDRFELDIRAKCVTVNSLIPSCLARLYLTMAYWYALTEAEQTTENDALAHRFAFKFLLPPDALKVFVTSNFEAGFVDICQVLDVPAYLIGLRYFETEEYDQILDRNLFYMPWEDSWEEC